MAVVEKIGKLPATGPSWYAPEDHRWRLYLVSALLLVAWAGALTLDGPLSAFPLHKYIPNTPAVALFQKLFHVLQKLFQLCEPFGHGLGISAVRLGGVRA